MTAGARLHPPAQAAPSIRQAQWRTQLGQRSEQLALRHLRKEGYRILEQNVRFNSGEIDIVAQERTALCFVEVRATSSTA